MEGVPVAAWPGDSSFDDSTALYYRQLSARDVSEASGIALFSEFIYQIVVIGPGKSPNGFLNHQRLINVALHRRFGSNDYGSVLSCTRIAPLSLPFVGENRSTFQMLGGRYRIRAQAVSE